MDLSEYVEDNSLAIFVRPGSPRSEIVGWDDNRKALKVNIAARPEKDKANAEVRRFFSRLTGRKVRILKGSRARAKVIGFY